MTEKHHLPQNSIMVKNEIPLSMQTIISATRQMREFPYNFAKHIHKSIEIYLIDSGQCSMNINNTKCTFQKNDFIIIFQNTVHSLYMESPNTCSFRHIHFDPAPFSQWILNQNEHYNLNLISALTMPCEHYYHLSANKKISSLVTSIIEETEEEGILSIALSNIHLVELMLHIIKLTHPDLSLITDIGAQTPEHIRYVSYALSYIHENFSKKILIPEIAAHLNISARYLSKIFFQHMNLTILNYINLYRINHAIDLMLHTDLTLTNISAIIGLKDSQHFSKLFKNAIGIPPNQYRKLIIHDTPDETSGKEINAAP